MVQSPTFVSYCSLGTVKEPISQQQLSQQRFKMELHATHLVLVAGLRKHRALHCPGLWEIFPLSKRKSISCAAQILFVSEENVCSLCSRTGQNRRLFALHGTFRSPAETEAKLEAGLNSVEESSYMLRQT